MPRHRFSKVVVFDHQVSLTLPRTDSVPLAQASGLRRKQGDRWRTNDRARARRFVPTGNDTFLHDWFGSTLGSVNAFGTFADAVLPGEVKIRLRSGALIAADGHDQIPCAEIACIAPDLQHHRSLPGRQ